MKAVLILLFSVISIFSFAQRECLKSSLIPYKEKEKVGYKDTLGKVVIRAKYTEVQARYGLEEGYKIVSNGKHDFLYNEEGKLLFKNKRLMPKRWSIQVFAHDCFAYKRKNKNGKFWTIKNLKTNWKSEPYLEVNSAIFSSILEVKEMDRSFSYYFSQVKQQILEDEGNTLIVGGDVPDNGNFYVFVNLEETNVYIYDEKTHDLVAKFKDCKYWLTKEDKIAISFFSGRTVLYDFYTKSTIFDIQGKLFEEANFYSYDSSDEITVNGLQGLINLKGEWVLKPKYNWVSASGNQCKAKRNDSTFIIDLRTKQEYFICTSCRLGFDYCDSVLKMTDVDFNPIKVIDAKGKTILPSSYEFDEYINEKDVFSVKTPTRNPKTFYKGIGIINRDLDTLMPFNEDYTRVRNYELSPSYVRLIRRRKPMNKNGHTYLSSLSDDLFNLETREIYHSINPQNDHGFAWLSDSGDTLRADSVKYHYKEPTYVVGKNSSLRQKGDLYTIYNSHGDVVFSTSSWRIEPNLDNCDVPASWYAKLYINGDYIRDLGFIDDEGRMYFDE